LDRLPLTDRTQNTLGVIQIETLAALTVVDETAPRRRGRFVRRP
jgi:hypothetical protein